MYNWHDAAPLFARAERLFREERNNRNALYAHLGALRLTPSLPIEARSREIGRLLSTNKLLQTDRSLRLLRSPLKVNWTARSTQRQRAPTGHPS
jgi:hypothetical protein